jgi:hypothetical protein
MSEARDITDGDFACLVQFSANYANRRFNPDMTGANTVQMSKRCYKPDSAMAAHSQICHVIEEDNSGIG